MEINDVITTKSWQSFCDYIYKAPDWTVPEGGVVWVCMDEIPQFFQLIKGTGRSYIIVSSHSDYGLALQSEYPIINDIVITSKKIIRGTNPERGYKDIGIPPACNLNKCSPHHRYSVKFYGFTVCTLPRIPVEVKRWYLVNNMCQQGEDDRLVNIPFGVPEGKEEIFANLTSKKKTNLLYVNFADYTFERIALKEYFRHQPWVTFKENVPFEEYLQDIQTHYFTICPNGNGVDSYRPLEVIYAGGTPIVERNHTFQGLNLPLLMVDNFYGLSPERLEILKESEQNSCYTHNEYNSTQLSYWRSTINKAKEETL